MEDPRKELMSRMSRQVFKVLMKELGDLHGKEDVCRGLIMAEIVLKECGDSIKEKRMKIDPEFTDVFLQNIAKRLEEMHEEPTV